MAAANWTSFSSRRFLLASMSYAPSPRRMNSRPWQTKIALSNSSTFRLSGTKSSLACIQGYIASQIRLGLGSNRFRNDDARVPSGIDETPKMAELADMTVCKDEPVVLHTS
ncbi:uncharacterized protein UTRI_06353 [Ustilago trichophora]|uniref:Uncharacterized protein n=1 Tax=Ustilago trichophora TaxID=86804 RepID=A0A5C3EIL3_9BASI|nr:uncharacterized protein UTRI_06353 [Ustilago trichophora]